MKNWKFYIATFGCKVNQYESQALREAWKDRGGEETCDPAKADYIVVNSCAITAKAERNARNALFRLKQLGPDAKIILCGCAAQFYPDFQPRKNANWAMPDYCVPQARKRELLAGPEAQLANVSAFNGIRAYQRSRPVIKIQDGCSQKCSYCIVPQTRGAPASRPQSEILAECRTLARNGYGELVLSGINLRQYYSHGDFWDLLALLDSELRQEFRGALRLRVSSLDPAMLNQRALEVIASCSLLCPHLHLSLQHASRAILKSMRRSHYVPEDIIANCAALAQIWPVYGLGADILVGFPGESESDVKILMDFIAQLPLTYAHVFPYSRRQGTTAAGMAGQIPKSKKEERAWRIRELVSAKQKQFWEEQRHLKKMRIAADAPTGGAEGRGVNEYYTPCVFKWAGSRGDYHRLFVAEPIGICAKGIRVKS